MMPGAMPLRGPQGQVGGPRAGTSMRGGPMGRGDYGKYTFRNVNDFSVINRKVLSLLVSQVTIPKYAKLKRSIYIYLFIHMLLFCFRQC